MRTETKTLGYRFDDFHLDSSNRELRNRGEIVALNSKYFDVLLLLVSRQGQLVEKQQIFDHAWDGVFVTDAALTQCIKDIRKQLGDDASNPRYIKTVPKHGYIFIGQVIESSEADSTPVDGTAVAPAIARPYKFLDYYTEQDTKLFFGRETEIDLLCSQIVARRSFILHGRSGVGKSSILRAGILPRLKTEGHLVFVVRSFTDPLHQMTVALGQALALENRNRSGAGLDLIDMIKSASESSPGRVVTFILDQFEEFFSALSEDTRQRFIESVGLITQDSSVPARFVFALREDFLAEMSQFKPAIPEIFHHEYRLKRLTRKQAARAITEPATRAGCRLEPELVTRLLDDLIEKDVIDPPQLQIVCDNIYDSKEANGELTVAVYERLGTASQILAGYLERVLRRFNSSDLNTTRKILTSLISIDGRRKVLKSSDLIARAAGTGDNDASEVSKLIEELIAARIVRRRSLDGESWTELAHDFLTAEVSRWLTAEDMELKRARAVLERAIENYRAHDLLIDSDALDLLMPFGEKLGLTGEEADLLAMSLMNRLRSVPEWLARIAPSMKSMVADAMASTDAQVRLRAVEASLYLKVNEMKLLLREVSLWDRDLSVRKAASIALADWLGREAEELLSRDSDTKSPDPVRRAVSLAMIRDYDRSLVRFSHLSLPVALLVFFGLMWVRLRRGLNEILWQTCGSIVGGAASGFVGGLMLGAGLAMVRESGFIESLSLILALVSMGMFIGALGGLGVTTGMIAASLVAYRHSRWWSVIGGAAGGALIGGSSKLLGVDTLETLFGRSPTGLTGALEGSIIGAGLSLGVVLITYLVKNARPWHRVLGASLGSLGAGALLIVIGANLFSGSLEIVARLFADSQLRMDRLATFFGEVQYGGTTQVALGAMEGLLFGTGMWTGIELALRLKQKLSNAEESPDEATA